MLKILVLTSFIFISPFFEVNIPHGSNGILQKRNNEYLAIYNDIYSSDTYTIKVEYDNVTVGEKKNFDRANFGDSTFKILIIDNNLIFYGLMFGVFV